jgi:proteasome accessory factor B
MQVVDPKLSTGPQVGKNLELLSMAVFRQKRIKMRYYTFSRDEEQEREVDPYGLGFAGQAWNRGAWYLVGYCHWRQGVRIFKLQRVRGEVSFVTGDEQGPDYMIPPGFRVREHLGRTRWEWHDLSSALAGTDSAEPFEARVRFPAAVAGEIKALVPSARSVERSPDHETLSFQVHNRRPFVRFLLRYVPRLEVVAPDDLDGAVRELAREVLATYKGGA